MKKILFYHNMFFPLSETFIFNQVKGVSLFYDVTLLGREFVNDTIFPLKNEKNVQRLYVNFFDHILFYLQYRLKSYPLLISNRALSESIKNVEKQNIDLIYAQFGHMALAILPLAKALNIPLVVIFHGLDAAPITLKNKVYKQKLRDLFDYASKIIVVSSHMIDTLELSDMMHKVEVIPYGVDISKFNASENSVKLETEETENTISILHVGRIVGKKGVPDLIRVFNKLSEKYDNVRLEVIGDGSELNLCKKLANEKVVFYGVKTQDFIKEKLEQADIYILNSRESLNGDMEGLPNSILEALSMGKAVISTIHAGIPDVIKSGENGLLVKELDNDSLFIAMEQLVIDKELRIRLANNARNSILKNFTLDVMYEKLKKVFDSILDK